MVKRSDPIGLIIAVVGKCDCIMIKLKKIMESTIKSIRLKNETITKIEKLAKSENRSFTNMVETLLIKYAGNYDNKKDNNFKK
jgi:hypothetical protein